MLGKGTEGVVFQCSVGKC